MTSKRPSTQPNTQQALDAIETPQINTKAIGLIVGAFAIAWFTAFLVKPWLGVWVLWVMGVLTLAALGFGAYAWNLMRKQSDIVRVMRKAGTAEGRKEALAELALDSSDAMKTMARAQLLMQEDPNEALKVMESIDIEKAPSLLQDDLRANRAFMYLMNGKAREARKMVDEVRLDRQPNAKSKAMYAAVSAEAFARTGKADEAKKLLETFSAEDPSFGEVSALLYRAQIYTYFQTKNRGLARKAMTALATIDPNQLAHVMMHGTPEIKQAAKEVLSEMGAIPKMRMQIQR